MRYFKQVVSALAIGLSAMSAPASAQSVDLAQTLDDVVALDSQSWMFNSYDRGSMHNAQVLSRSSDGSTVLVYGDYTYNSGSSGWVKAQVENGRVRCIEFWDFSGCRSVGHPGSQQVAVALVALGAAAAVMSAAGGSSADQSSSHTPQPCYDFDAPGCH